MTYEFTAQNRNTNKIVDIINEHGIVFIPRYLVNSQLADVTKEAKSILSKTQEKAKYTFGKVVRLQLPLRQHPAISTCFKQKWQYNICVKYFGHGNFNMNDEVFIGHDYKETSDLSRNGFIHFDRGFCLKYLIYLSDVGENDGPFSIIPKTHEVGADLHKKAWKKTSVYRDVPNRLEIDYPEMGYTKDMGLPILGNAGDMFIFSTMLFHWGGIVKHNGSRLLIRGHTKL